MVAPVKAILREIGAGLAGQAGGTVNAYISVNGDLYEAAAILKRLIEGDIAGVPAVIRSAVYGRSGQVPA